MKIILIKFKEFLLTRYIRLNRKLRFQFTNKDLEYSKFKIGDFTYGFPRFFPKNSYNDIEIGKFCSIAGDVLIFGRANHKMDSISTYPFTSIAHGIETAFTKGKTIIGNDVWIGERAIILSGVKIGDGSVIGAGTIVSKSVPPYSVVVGNPGRVVRKRFNKEEIKKLLKIKWWDWNYEKIEKECPLLLGDINIFLKKHSETFS